MEQKTAPTGERAPTPTTDSDQKAGKKGSTGLRVNLNQHLASQVQKKPWFLFQLLHWDLESPIGTVSWGDHTWKLPRTTWAFSVQAWWRINTCLVPAGPWLGLIQNLPRLQLCRKVAWTPQSTRITGLGAPVHRDYRPGYLQPTGIPGQHIPGLW